MDLSTKELKAIAKIRGIKGYERMSEVCLKCSYFIKTSKKKVKNQKQIFLKQK